LIPAAELDQFFDALDALLFPALLGDGARCEEAEGEHQREHRDAADQRERIVKQRALRSGPTAEEDDECETAHAVPDQRTARLGLAAFEQAWDGEEVGDVGHLDQGVYLKRRTGGNSRSVG
jgi:hypothetical protein